MPHAEEVIQPIFTIDWRECLPDILNENRLLGEGAEVGVQEGEFSHWILTQWKGHRLYSIDPWRTFDASEYVDAANISQAEHDQNFEKTTALLAPFGDRSHIIRDTSENAAARFADASLDFVYLDAQHHYEAVKRDLQLWWRTIKRFGIFCGHDYIPDGVYPFGTFGVQKAVNEFIRLHNLDLILSEDPVVGEGMLATPSWFVVKKA